MSKVNLYILKRACADLQFYKLLERKYKANTVKRACYLLKSAADDDGDERGAASMISYFDAKDKDKKDAIRSSLDWTGWDNPLGRLIRRWIDLTPERKRALVAYLTSNDEFKSDKDRENFLIQYGITDPIERQKYLRAAGLNKYRGVAAAQGIITHARNAGVSEYNTAANAAIQDLNAKAEALRAQGVNVPRFVLQSDDSGKPKSSDDIFSNGLPIFNLGGRAPNYITDNLTFYHPELLEPLYASRGGVVNNYYYLNGKPIESAVGNALPGLSSITGQSEGKVTNKDLVKVLFGNTAKAGPDAGKLNDLETQVSNIDAKIKKLDPKDPNYTKELNGLLASRRAAQDEVGEIRRSLPYGPVHPGYYSSNPVPKLDFNSELQFPTEEAEKAIANADKGNGSGTAAGTASGKESTNLFDVMANNGFRNYDGSDMNVPQIRNSIVNTVEAAGQPILDTFAVPADVQHNLRHNIMGPVATWASNFVNNNRGMVNSLSHAINFTDGADDFDLTPDLAEGL